MNRILIVEDEEAISGLIAMSLERVGYTCEAVNDGLAAADRIEQNAYDALEISDRAYILETGRISLEGRSSDLITDERVKNAYLGGEV